ncbi:MAG: hypothetical protein AB7O24_19735 [Kofleriaceae bacterium]
MARPASCGASVERINDVALTSACREALEAIDGLESAPDGWIQLDGMEFDVTIWTPYRDRTLAVRTCGFDPSNPGHRFGRAFIESVLAFARWDSSRKALHNLLWYLGGDQGGMLLVGAEDHGCREVTAPHGTSA